MTENLVLKTDFSLNQQKAQNEGNRLMISPLLAGLHHFADEAKVFFKDINQKDEVRIGNFNCKVYTRDITQDEDMLIHEQYFQQHPEIDLFIMCKIKGGMYDYLGYVTRELVNQTRIVEMIGADSDNASGKIRRIFSDQYTHLNTILKIYEEEQIEKIKITPQNYIPLHLHGEFSIGDSYGTCKMIAENLYLKGFKGAAITDHGTLAGVWEFQKALLEHNIKPIIGCEFYVKVTPDQEKNNHITILVKNKKGYENILKLQAIATRENFYYHPVILLDQIFQHKEGLIIMSACSNGVIAKNIAEGNYEEAKKIAEKIKSEFNDDFYFEIMLHQINGNQAVMKLKYDLAKSLGIKCVFTTDSHYPNKEDRRYHEAVKAINYRKDYGQAGFGEGCFYILTDDDINSFLINEAEWLKTIIAELKLNTFEVFEKCNFNIKQAESQDTLPKLIPDKHQQEEIFKQMVYDGLAKYTPYKNEGVIKERLNLELDRIISKGYINYFLIVADMIREAKSKGIFVGPGRGSVGASLVAYCLNITEVDPIEHDLLFSRFLGPARKDLPDCDVDYQDDRRIEVFDYLKNKYGENHCCKVATYSRFHGKGIMRDIGRIFKIPVVEIEKINSLIIERCIAKDSKILLNTGKTVALEKLFKINEKLKKQEKTFHKRKKIYGISYNLNSKRFRGHIIKDIYDAGEKQMYKITTETGKTIEASAEHRFYTEQGWKMLKDLTEQDKIMTYCENVKNSSMFERIIKIEKTSIKKCYDISMSDASFNNKKHTKEERNSYLSNFIANFIVCKNSGGDARASLSLTDTFLEFEEAKKFKALYEIAVDVACKLEGTIRHKGLHAAAMAVTENDVCSFVPINKINGEVVTEFEKQACEDAGLIKFDILGLNTLTIIGDCMKTSGAILPKKFEDIKVYETVFQKGKTLGVFQFNTTGMGKLIQQLMPTDFHTLYDACSLYRPSCLHSGQTMQYVNRKLGKEKIEYMHHLLEPITKNTLGVLIFQEQVMQIMHSVGGLSWATAESARKIITKSKGKDAFNKIREEFVRNAKSLHKIPEEESNKLYDVVSTFGSYGMNKAHTVEYSIISYWCAWLKTYYPQHFYNALLKHEKDEAIIQEAITEAQSLGFIIEYPDINKSDINYSLVDSTIYAGFNSIIGIGNKVASKIIANRPYTSIEDFKKRTKCSDKLFNALVIADCFRVFNKNRKQILSGKTQLSLSEFGLGVTIPQEDFTDLEIAQQIIELTKLKPNVDIKKLYDFGKYNFIDIANITQQHAGTIQQIRGICTAVYNKDKLLRHELKQHQFKFEEHMIYLNINDGTGNIAAQINPATYEKYQTLLQNADKQPISIIGRITADGKKMYADILQLVGKYQTHDIDNLAKTIKSINNNH
jgi:DNA polymerase III alpha subunit